MAITELPMTSPRSERRCTSKNGRCAGSRRRVGTVGRSGDAERFGGRCDGCQRTVAPVAPSRILGRRRLGDVRVGVLAPSSLYVVAPIVIGRPIAPSLFAPGDLRSESVKRVA